jgi:hypothetical protein
VKRAIIILTVFIVGALLGGLVAHFITVVRYGIKQSRMSRVYEESLVGEFGSNAFTAYLSEPTDAGIYALRYHLDQLDRQERKWGTNWAVMDIRDVNWMRAAAHTRLAFLYTKAGRRDLTSNQLAAAWDAFSAMHVRVRGITNRNDLVRYVQDEDRKGKWW